MEINQNTSMFISRIAVKNFRSIASEIFDLRPFTTLIGKNNAGKSNTMRAVSLLLEGTPTSISERDFFDSNVDIQFEATVSNVKPYLDLLADQHRTKVEKCLTGGELKIRRQTNPSDRKLSKLEIWQPDKEEYGLPTGIDAALKQILPEVIFIEAFADPAGEASGKASTTFGKIIKQIVEPITDKVGAQLKAAFTEFNYKLNLVFADDGTIKSDERVQEIKNVETSLKTYLGKIVQGSDVRLVIDPPNLSNIMTNAEVELWDSGIWTSAALKGQGLQRALYVALLQTLADQVRKSSEKELQRPYLLMVEEPEIFLHPSLQSQMRDALLGISMANPVLIATHSPTMIVPEMLPDTILVRKENDISGRSQTRRLRPVREEIEKESDKRVSHLLQYQRSSSFLFSDRVAVVEGISDIVLFEAIWEVTQGRTPERDGVGFVDAESKLTVPSCRRVLDSIGLPTLGIVDLDFLWDGAGHCFKADAAYSLFCENFWKAANVNDMIEKKNDEPHIIKGRKTDAFKLLTNSFAKEKAELLERLKVEHNIWVLHAGEIENYVGLTTTSKGQYATAAREIRMKQRPIHCTEELLGLFEMIVTIK